MLSRLPSSSGWGPGKKARSRGSLSSRCGKQADSTDVIEAAASRMPACVLNVQVDADSKGGCLAPARCLLNTYTLWQNACLYYTAHAAQKCAKDFERGVLCPPCCQAPDL
jgi:hypothetical protein